MKTLILVAFAPLLVLSNSYGSAPSGGYDSQYKPPSNNYGSGGYGQPKTYNHPAPSYDSKPQYQQQGGYGGQKYDSKPSYGGQTYDSKPSYGGGSNYEQKGGDWQKGGDDWNKGGQPGWEQGGNQPGWNSGSQPGWNGGSQPGWEQNGGGAKPWEQNGGGQAPEWNN